jgi:uroporphyrin-III C-methyltransferase
VLLVDDLVSDAIVALASPGSARRACRQTRRLPSTPQAFIEKLMVTAARDGETVVRLKGGDPFIFGRGGEEVEHLRAAGIAARWSTASPRAWPQPTRWGVPLTHRDHAQGVVFITGHAKRGGAADRLARAGRDRRTRTADAGDLHGRGRCAGAAGRLADRTACRHPVAVVQDASLPTQRCVTELGNWPAPRAEHIASPAIIVVGEVARAAVPGAMADRHTLRAATVATA